ncbi:MAG: complex I subunit 5 family protein, partial [Spirochaetota bacterium]
MNPETLVFGPVILPLFGAALIFCAKAFLKGSGLRRLEYIGVFIGLALPWATLAYTAPLILSGETIQGVIGGWYGGVGIMFRFDGLAWLVNILGFSVAGAAWVYSLGGGPKGPSFSAIFLIQTAALAATIMTADVFNLFVCLEVLGIASYVLVASTDKPGASLASFSYLMVSAAAMVFFLIGVYGLYRLTGSLSYQGIASGLQGLPEEGGILALVSLALVVSAVAMRVAVMPLYGWLPDAHALAPHAVSAVLSGVLIKTPLFALSRVLLLMPAGAQAGELLGYAGAATALVGVIIALSQKDAKRLLA